MGNILSSSLQIKMDVECSWHLAKNIYWGGSQCSNNRIDKTCNAIVHRVGHTIPLTKQLSDGGCENAIPIYADRHADVPFFIFRRLIVEKKLAQGRKSKVDFCFWIEMVLVSHTFLYGCVLCKYTILFKCQFLTKTEWTQNAKNSFKIKTVEWK